MANQRPSKAATWITLLGTVLIIGLTSVLFGCQKLYTHYGGNFSGAPEDILNGLSPKAKELIDSSFNGIPDGQYVDHHVHIIGYEQGAAKVCPEEGIDQYRSYINPKRFSWGNPVLRVKTEVFMNAADIRELNNASEQYAMRLFELVKHFGIHGKFFLLALDGYYELDGILNWEKTDLLIPNEYVVGLAECLNRKLGKNAFEPVISIHPYRVDAVSRLQYFAQKKGVRYVKWLPNAMNINPGKKENMEYFKTMVKLNMILIAHTGDESSLETESQNQRLGNPLGYKLALDLGVTVIMSHLGSYGESRNSQRVVKKNYEIFYQMLEEAKKTGKWNLYGDLSAITLEKNLENLKTLFNKQHLWDRIVNGSDYPIPAVSFLNNTSIFCQAGFITEEEKKALDEIYGYNPLLFDFVFKRTLKNPSNQGQKLPPEMFLSVFPGKL
jgi:predicted TIM-barrel fold metal-dependent hydrolase